MPRAATHWSNVSPRTPPSNNATSSASASSAGTPVRSLAQAATARKPERTKAASGYSVSSRSRTTARQRGTILLAQEQRFVVARHVQADLVAAEGRRGHFHAGGVGQEPLRRSHAGGEAQRRAATEARIDLGERRGPIVAQQALHGDRAPRPERLGDSRALAHDLRVVH